MLLSTKIIILGILIILSALFSGTETAILSVNKLRVRHLKEKKVKNAETLEALKEESHKTISTLLIGNNLVNIAASSIATSIAIDAFGSAGVGIATGFMTFVILVFAEITPKTIANNHPDKIALFFSKVLRSLSWLFTPLRVILDIFTKYLTKAFGVNKATKTVTEEEIKSIVNLGEQEGEIKPIERVMINNIFKFNDIEVDNIMTSRKDALIFDSSLNVKEVMPKIIKSGFSRFPVYEKNMDNITGICYLKDIIKDIQKNKNPSLKEIAKKPFYIPETKMIDELLREFQKKKIHIAIVVDEYGVFQGLVTIEDLLEEIVGDIYDEQDKVVNNIRKTEKGEFVIKGDTPIKDINRELKTKIKYDPYETISAYLLHMMGRIPKTGDKFMQTKNTYEIIEMDNTRIVKIKLKKK